MHYVRTCLEEIKISLAIAVLYHCKYEVIGPWEKRFATTLSVTWIILERYIVSKRC